MIANNGNERATDPAALGESRKDKTFTRRRFVSVAAVYTFGGLAYGSGIMESFAGVVEDVSSFDAPNLLLQPATGRIVRVSIDESACASCGMCILVCAAAHGNEIGRSRSGIWLDRHPFQCVYDTIACHQCDAPECLFACHGEGGGAMFVDTRTGARTIEASKCIGCGKCIDACVFSTPRINLDLEQNIAFKCDLCSGRAEGPACVEFCPHQALMLQREE